MIDNEIIVESIKTLCKNHNITMSQLEKDVGLSQGLVSKWMNTTPSLDKIVDIAHYFNVSVDDVIGYYKDAEDDFLQALIEQTKDKTLTWKVYDEILDKSKYTPHNLLSYKGKFPYETYKQISIFTLHNQCYIHLSCVYKVGGSISDPKGLCLSITPIDSKTVVQKYNINALKELYFKVTKINIKSPEIKVNDFKNDFINDFKKQSLSRNNKTHILNSSDNTSSTEELLLITKKLQQEIIELQQEINKRAGD